MRVTSTGHVVLLRRKTAQRSEQFRVQELLTVVTDAQTVKSKAEKTVETDAQAKKRQTAVTPDAAVFMSEDLAVQGSETEQRVVVPSEVCLAGFHEELH